MRMKLISRFASLLTRPFHEYYTNDSPLGAQISDMLRNSSSYARVDKRRRRPDRFACSCLSLFFKTFVRENNNYVRTYV